MMKRISYRSRDVWLCEIGAEGITPRDIRDPSASYHYVALPVARRETVRRLRGKESILLGLHIEHTFRRYFAVVFPLLIVAAAIEAALILNLR
jgi:hypothetical protein